MAMKGRAKAREPLPPPLPPETRTVGQLVAETINLYRRRFWPSLSLGIGPAVSGVTIAELPTAARLPFALTVGAAAASSSYAIASAWVAGLKPTPQRLLPATAVGIAVLAPVVLLLVALGFLGLLPLVVWLGLTGFVVPVRVIEDRLSLRRALRLARADLVHTIGSLATLALVGLLTTYVVFFTLRSAGTAALRASAFLSVLVISPILFLGAALLYFDQAARDPTRRSDADVHHAVDPDRPGRPDSEGEPRAAARGKP
jgi:hypothetical protein